MATTKIWRIKDSVKRVIEYARNPEKTEYNDLARELHYIEDGIHNTKAFLFCFVLVLAIKSLTQVLIIIY